jgi:hypothetical protein
MSICEKHRKFAEYWEELGKPQLEYKNVEGIRGSGLWSFVLGNMPSWDDPCDYRIAGDRHFAMRKKWVDSDKTLPIERNKYQTLTEWKIVNWPEWRQDYDYREAVEKHEDICESSPLQTQVGGSHYKDMKIQPAEYTHANGIGHLAGDAIAYISRYKSKNGRQDLEKAIHSLQLLIQLEYGE